MGRATEMDRLLQLQIYDSTSMCQWDFMFNLLYILIGHIYNIWISNILDLSVADEDYSRNTSSALIFMKSV
jgi:hypothetical protein